MWNFIIGVAGEQRQTDDAHPETLTLTLTRETSNFRLCYKLC